ncbi:MAG: hypothetical protein KDM64_03325 [Verrucomicrobiae bacterium]|nr:hypothetical protein [Verrucomicrobiae bacterium]
MTMKLRLLLGVTSTATLILSGCGDSQPDSPANSASAVVQGALDRYDANGDGMFSEAERQSMEADFVAKFDTDGDGTLNEAENREARRKSRVTVVASSSLPGTREEVEAFLRPFDADGNGKISSNEAGERQWLILQRADTDRDGFVTVEEWLARNTRMGAVAKGQ